MKAMVFAAGLGKRMMPLTKHTPKPMLRAGGKPLIEYHIERLSEAGITELVINVAYLGEKIKHFCGDGSRWGVSIAYSEESRPLETGGGLSRALPLLGAEPFVVINSDIWTDYPLQQLRALPLRAAALGHLVLVPNPSHNRGGDYSMDEDGFLSLPRGGADAGVRHTFSGISLIRPEMIQNYPRRREVFRMVEMLNYYLPRRRLTAEVFTGTWRDIGSPERLAALEKDIG
ncbi:nucleotidyltransferase family protein [Exilibacterium tricleocarpae]|uniref:Nucleotidyltransferase family protein n=1 Tax=Exilibacterium tricleocarpae TaxID=2591008 RepID=A0A545T3J0_9GAMM|nr:nucleotidyltransferase family protein [Exilibacterium tricleocarpae]TQV71784.1 nucleotidyltransferase family protein [Exilibacterium tricleocarpae]